MGLSKLGTINTYVSILAIILTMNTVSCQNETMNEKQAKEKTEELIGQEIEVLSFEHVKPVKEYRLEAKTLDDLETIFRVNFSTKTGNLLTCNLPQQKWDNELSSSLQEWLGNSFEKHKLDITFYSSEEQKVDFSSIPKLETVLANSDASNKLEIRVYLFQDLTDEVYEEIVNLVHKVREMPLETVNYQFTFYDQEYFADKTLEEYTFGFKALKKDFFEMIEKDQLRKRIVFELPQDSEIPTLEVLKSITDQKPNMFGSKPNRL